MRQSCTNPLIKSATNAWNGSKRSLPLVIGIWGNIGVGKSTFCRKLTNCAPAGRIIHINADIEAHSLYDPGTPVYEAVLKQFGPSIIHPTAKTIERAKLGQIVFADPQKMKLLTGIVWPELTRKLQQRLTTFEKDKECKLVLLEAAALIEAGWHKSLCQEVLLLYTSFEEAKRRAVGRGTSLNNFQKAWANQMKRDAVKDELRKSGVSFEERSVETDAELDQLLKDMLARPILG